MYAELRFMVEDKKNLVEIETNELGYQQPNGRADRLR